MRIQAVNNVIILKKDRSYIKDDPDFSKDTNYKSKEMNEIPEPYTGTVDSIGFEQDVFKIGQRIAFEEIGGVYIAVGETEYVVITPDMVIGFLE